MKVKLVRVAMTAIALVALAFLLAPQAAKAAPAVAKNSTGSCSWSTSSCWTPSGVPTNADDVTILSGHTVTASTSGQIARNVTINSGGTLTLSGQNINVAGNWTNNGTFNNGGVGVIFTATSGTQTISGTGTGQFAQLAINDGSTSTSGANVQLLVNATAGETTNSLQLQTGDLDLNGHTLTLNGTSVANRGIRVMGTPTGGTRTIFSSTGTGTLLISGTKYVCGVSGTTCGGTSWPNAGTLTIGTGAVVALGATFDFNGSTTGATTLNGTLRIDSGGSLLNSHTPTYGSASTLVYNTTASVSTEWGAGTSAGSGVPQNVTVQAGTLTFLASTSRTVPGNLTIASGATLADGANTLAVKGNVSNAGTHSGTGKISLANGSATHTLSGAGTWGNLQVNDGTYGATLGSNITINGTLELAAGDLNAGTGTNQLTLTGPGNSVTSAGGGDVIGDVVRGSLSTGTTYTFNNPNTSLNFASGTPPTSVTLNLNKVKPPELTTAITRTYTITPTGGSGYAATLSLRYANGENGGMTEANLKLWRYNGTRYVLQGGTDHTDTTNPYVSLTGVGTFSPWAITDNGNGSPTAVRLSNFGARSEGLDPTLTVAGIGVLGMMMLGGIGFVATRRRSR